MKKIMVSGIVLLSITRLLFGGATVNFVSFPQEIETFGQISSTLELFNDSPKMVKTYGITIELPNSQEMQIYTDNNQVKIFNESDKVWSISEKKAIFAKYAMADLYISRKTRSPLLVNLSTVVSPSSAEFAQEEIKIGFRAFIKYVDGTTAYYPARKSRDVEIGQQGYLVKDKYVTVVGKQVTNGAFNHDAVVNTPVKQIKEPVTPKNDSSDIKTIKAEDLVAFPNDYAYNIVSIECDISNDTTITYEGNIRSYDINLNCSHGNLLDFSSSMNLAMNLATVTTKKLAKLIRSNEGKKCIVTGKFKPKNISGTNTLFIHTLFIHKVYIVE